MAVSLSVVGAEACIAPSNLPAPLTPADMQRVPRPAQSPAHSHHVAAEHFCFYGHAKREEKSSTRGWSEKNHGALPVGTGRGDAERGLTPEG